MYTREEVRDAVQKLGYKWFSDHKDKGYDVNIVGIRNSETANQVTNRFDDKMTVSYKNEDGEWQYHEFDCTTDPGTHWVNNILNPEGVAILKPGQYRGSHKIRLHGGRYTALGQQKPVKVYRDGNKDEIYDMIEDNVREGLYGINIHRATAKPGRKSTQVDKWSAGCQVIASSDNFALLMEICHKAKDIWGNSFTYTLLESKDL